MFRPCFDYNGADAAFDTADGDAVQRSEFAVQFGYIVDGGFIVGNDIDGVEKKSVAFEM